MKLTLTAKQSQILSPQMLQSIQILQMGTQELLEYIEETVQENPALEASEPSDPEHDFTALRKELEWLNGAGRQESYSPLKDGEEEPDPLEHYGGIAHAGDSLYEYLLSQLQAMELPSKLAAAARCVAESLNDNGFLDEPLEDLARAFGVETAYMEKGLQIIQQLDPAGVGARTLGECLCLQLDRREEDTSLARKIVAGHLPSLAKNRYSQIAKALSAPPEAVRAACELIRSLNPKPGVGFAAREPLQYITPDLFVDIFPDHMELTANDRYFPTLKLSAYYKTLMEETEDAEVRDYLTGKVRQAQWVIKNIEQRRSTLLRCAECILETQEDFFRLGAGHLVPLCLRDISAKLGIHESTVSRAVRDKYLQCPHGVYPLSYFFSRSLNSAPEEHGITTPEAAKSLLKKLICGEDRQKPLSDQKLCALMAEQGCSLSRRTVAKYRDELRIPRPPDEKNRNKTAALCAAVLFLFILNSRAELSV